MIPTQQTADKKATKRAYDAARYAAMPPAKRKAKQRARNTARKLLRRTTDIDKIIRLRVNSVRERAARKKLAFELTDKYIRELYDACPRDAVTWQAFDQTKAGKLTIDRIDNNGGYTIGNVRLVRWHTNLALNVFGDVALKAMAAAIMAKDCVARCES
jgi:hypothetical protein